MVRNSGDRELWLQAACLAVSVGLHAGLGALGWQSLEAVPVDDRAVIVTLVDKLPASVANPNPSAAPLPVKAQAAPPVRRTVAALAPPRPRPQPVSTVDALCAVPEAAVVETPADDLATDADVGADDGAGGTAAGGGNRRGAAGSGSRYGRAADGEGGGLIKATPRYESNPLPYYPRLARQNRWEGTVRLRARVSATGEVEGVSLERSSGHAVLDRSALDGVQLWRFIPARQGGVPVACEVSIPVAFRLTEP